MSSEDFARAYAEWADELDALSAGPLWWATSLPSRHPQTLALPRRLFALRARAPTLPACASLKSAACALLPLGPLSAAASVAGRMVLARLFSREAPPAGLVDALFTLAGPRSFDSGSYRDQFFGDLPWYLSSKGRLPFLFVFVTADFAATVRRLPTGAAPIELFLTASGFGRALATALKAWAFGIPAKAPPFEGNDVGSLVAEECACNAREGRLLRDLVYGEALKGLASRVELSALYYPFENLARERSLLLAVRQAAPNARTIGYQHAPLTARQLNCRLGPRGAETLPLPDLIVASGPAAARRLADLGWPAARLRSGCALRASPVSSPKPRPGRPRLLVLLSQGHEEYSGLLKLLREAFAGRDDAPEITLRPHPVIALSPDAGPWRVEAPPLADALESCSAVLYASSAAAIDAARAGVPVIWAVWGDWLPADPLTGLPDGHSEARDGASLRAAFTAAAARDDSARVAAATSARAFLDDFSAVPTPESMAVFLA